MQLDAYLQPVALPQAVARSLDLSFTRDPFDRRIAARTRLMRTITFQKSEDATVFEHPCGSLARFEPFFEERANLAGGTLPVLTKSPRVSSVKQRAVTKASSPARWTRRV